MKPLPSDAPVELVVGADSTIGGELLRSLKADGRPALGTSRRPGRPGMYLDLADPPQRWQGPPVAVAYLCAAVTRLDDCQRDPQGTARVNVAGTLHLAQLLASQGASLVFLSTNHVFDGARPFRRIDEEVSPLNEYGRQKAEAERCLRMLGQTAILRLTKVLGGPNPLFAGWARSLVRGERIRPFHDLVVAPVPLHCVCSVLRQLGAEQRSGIWHLSGDRDLSYAEAAFLGASVLGANSKLIEPTAMRSQPHAEQSPRYTTLDVSPLPQALGVNVPDVTTTVREAFRLQAPAVAAA